MPAFILDERLAADCYQLGSLGQAELLLLNNANFPWLVLVPHTQHTEFFQLSSREQQALLASVNTLSAFIKQHFSSDKLNIAMIGNIVSQLHIHIIGRSKEDACWPGVVWGTSQHKAYASNAVQTISAALAKQLGSSFNSSSKTHAISPGTPPV